MSIISESEKDGCGDVGCKVTCMMPIVIDNGNLLIFHGLKLIINVTYCRTIYVYVYIYKYNTSSLFFRNHIHAI